MTDSIDIIVNRIKKHKEYLLDIKHRCPQQWYESFTEMDNSNIERLKLSSMHYRMLLNSVYDIPREWSLEIDKVIFNKPATIVFWKNGCKTVVKCQDDEPFDPEKGLAMAIAKYALGNKGNYYNTFTKYLPKGDKINEKSNN